MTVPVVELEDVAVGYGDGPDVLMQLNLTVEVGEFVTIIGASGCGKSTILNVVSGLLKPRRGEARFLGKSIKSVNTNVGYMTQEDTLLPWRTVEDNVSLPLKLRRLPRAEIRERVSDALKQTQLSDFTRMFPSQLSGGMKRRALLARSMVYAPAVLLMDEPFAALDAQLRTQMHLELRQTISAVGQSVLFITHDINEALVLSDRVVVLGGKPAAPIASFDIPFGDRRGTGLQYEEEFVRLGRDLHESLSSARSIIAQSDHSELSGRTQPS